MKNTNRLVFALLAAAALLFAAGCSDGDEESGSSSLTDSDTPTILTGTVWTRTETSGSVTYISTLAFKNSIFSVEVESSSGGVLSEYSYAGYYWIYEPGYYIDDSYIVEFEVENSSGAKNNNKYNEAISSVAYDFDPDGATIRCFAYSFSSNVWADLEFKKES